MPELTGRVGRTARYLGFAGLLPQFAAVVAVAGGVDYRIGERVALSYAALILSFLGGTWWGLAMRREHGQAPLVALAVVPSLVAYAIVLGHPVLGIDTSLYLLAAALVGTLVVDRRLARSGDAPADWLALRVPLSLGLGALTASVGLF